eukprot:6455056-Amphidinium_carterae.7
MEPEPPIIDELPSWKITHKKPRVLDVEAYVSAVQNSGKRPTIATLLLLLLTWVFDMRGFFQEAVANLMSDYPELKVRPVDCPNPSPLGTSELESALTQKGTMSTNAAKHLMKLMYGARMAFPQILTTITRLACNITKWTKEDDR